MKIENVNNIGHQINQSVGQRAPISNFSSAVQIEPCQEKVGIGFVSFMNLSENMFNFMKIFKFYIWIFSLMMMKAWYSMIPSLERQSRFLNSTIILHTNSNFSSILSLEITEKKKKKNNDNNIIGSHHLLCT